MPKSSRTRPKSPFPIARIAFALALIAALVLRLWITTRNTGLTMDSPLYVRMAEALAHGSALPGPAHHGYPALIALAGTVIPGREWPGRVVSLLAGVALVAIVYALARRRLSPAWSAVAAWLVALHPLAALYSGAIMTEAWLVALMYGAVLALSHHGPLAAGGLFGLGWLVRPEALAVAPAAALLVRPTWRHVLWMLLGIAAFVLPYTAFLRWERGAWMLTPKTVLVRPLAGDRRQAEWRLTDSTAVADSVSLAERSRVAAPSIAREYLPRLVRHAGVLLESWPWPLMALAALGAWAAWGALFSPLVLLLGLPLLAVPFDARFALLFLPALAVFAAAGAAWVSVRFERQRMVVAAVASALLALGVFLTWNGPPGALALHFDDGPMPQMREAGAWLRGQGRAGLRVMDRKAYVPFFAGAEHVQFPNDDYDRVLEYARRGRVDYIVFEEYLIPVLRPQFLPLVQDAEFRLRERRVRQAFVTGRVPMTGVAIFEVVRDSSAWEGGR